MRGSLARTGRRGMPDGRWSSRASYCADMTALDAQSLAARVDELMPQVRADLEQLVAIPSINFPWVRPVGCRALRPCLCTTDHRCRRDPAVDPQHQWRADRARRRPSALQAPHRPAVLALRRPACRRRAKWDSAPFVAEDGMGASTARRRGRQVGVVTHIAVLRAFDGTPRCRCASCSR